MTPQNAINTGKPWVEWFFYTNELSTKNNMTPQNAINTGLKGFFLQRSFPQKNKMTPPKASIPANCGLKGLFHSQKLRVEYVFSGMMNIIVVPMSFPQHQKMPSLYCCGLNTPTSCRLFAHRAHDGGQLK